jgi:hypothetical protein
MRTVVVLAFVVGATGCGLDMAGLGASAAGDASASPDGPHADGSGSGGGDGGQGSDGGGTDGASLPPAEAGACVPSGWSLVAYEASRASCPGGYGASHDEVSGATAGAGACACSCNVTTQPSCDQGTLVTQWSPAGPSNGPCSNPGPPLTMNGSACTAFAGPVALEPGFSASPFAPTGGACTAAVNPDPSKVTKAGVRFCDVPPPAAEAVCSGAAPSGFAACLVAPGDVPCPTGPFATRTVVADDVELVCPTCGPCTVAGTCGSAQIRFYSDGQCAALAATLSCDGACVSAGGGPPKTVAAYEYSAHAQATCTASPIGATSLAPVRPQTLCCR